MLQFQGEFRTQIYDNITELVKNFKYQKFKSVLVYIARLAPMRIWYRVTGALT
jgi:hypothetical protein